jgi:hypothetical protein
MQKARTDVEMERRMVGGLFGAVRDLGELGEMLEKELRQINEVMKEDELAMSVVEEIGMELMEGEDNGAKVRWKMEAAIAERRLEWW